MTDVASIYPIFGDWDGYTRDLAANTLRLDNSWTFLSTSLAVFFDLDDTQVEILRQMDPNVATGALLDSCGSRIGEPRGGLDDFEYRQIILGRYAAGVANGTASGIWTTWLAVTGTRADRARMTRWGPDDLPLVWLWAQVDLAPSAPFLQRAGAVIRDAVAYPMDVLAGIGVAPMLLTDTSPGFDSALLVYSLETAR